MSAYLTRRLLLLIPTLFLLSILVFLSVRFIPGDVIDVIVGRMDMGGGYGRVDREALEQMLGLDVPVWVQYGRWMGGILLHGTLGGSLYGGWPVEERLFDRLPVTLELGVMAIVIGLVIALPVGIYSAIRQDTVAGLRGAHPRNPRLGHAELLAGHYGDDLPGHLVGLVSPDGTHTFYGRPAEESRHLHHSQPDCGDGPLGQHHAPDAHHDAGGAPPGLYPHCLGQGA